jgi:hypothetical protein
VGGLPTLSDPGKGEIFPVRTTKVYRKIRSMVQSFLTSAPDGGGWSTSCLGHFTPTNEPCYPLSRRPGGPRAGLNIFVKRNLAQTGLWTLDHPAHSLVPLLTTLHIGSRLVTNNCYPIYQSLTDSSFVRHSTWPDISMVVVCVQLQSFVVFMPSDWQDCNGIQNSSLVAGLPQQFTVLLNMPL